MNSAKSLGSKKNKWILSTVLLLAAITISYMVMLFPKDTSSALLQYLSLFAIPLVVMAVFTLAVALFIITKKKVTKKTNINQDNHLKTIAQLIWRYRYVLRSTKTRLTKEDNIANKQKWENKKAEFARIIIFPVIPETKISTEQVSQLIEKSLKGVTVNNVNPPIYKVTDITSYETKLLG